LSPEKYLIFLSTQRAIVKRYEEKTGVCDLRQLQATEDFYTLAMISIEAKLNCERHIADLKLRIAQLKAGSRLGSDVSAEFIDLLQHNLDSWEERKKTLADHH
jgi:hypothetical protein